jgi:catechol 2,3-dioxygenase-like lactoylglutathione lyase family enzyme
MMERQIAAEFVDIDHLGVNVTDLARSEAWYRDILGFGILHRWPTTTLVGLGSVKLGLFWRPDARRIDNLDDWVCMQHLAFLVDAYRFMQTRQSLIDAGVDVLDEDNGIGYCVFFEDPDGHLLELITYHATPNPDLSAFFDPHTHSPQYFNQQLRDHVPKRPSRVHRASD